LPLHSALGPSAWPQAGKSGAKPVPLAAAAEAKNIAADAYIQTYPLLLTARDLDRQMNRADAADYVGKVNAFRHQDGLPSPKDASVRKKSFDAPYSWAWIDVRVEPVVLWLPAIPAGRFAVVQLYDIWGHNPRARRRQRSAGRPFNVLVAGPGWKGTPPKGIDCIVVGHIARRRHCARRRRDAGRRRGIAALQSQYKLALSHAKRRRLAAAPIGFPSWTKPRRIAAHSSATSTRCCPSSGPMPASRSR
jgi:hypothetical protein